VGRAEELGRGEWAAWGGKRKEGVAGPSRAEEKEKRKRKNGRAGLLGRKREEGREREREWASWARPKRRRGREIK
jgi:hypothetical protein